MIDERETLLATPPTSDEVARACASAGFEIVSECRAELKLAVGTNLTDAVRGRERSRRNAIAALKSALTWEHDNECSCFKDLDCDCWCHWVQRAIGCLTPLEAPAVAPCYCTETWPQPVPGKVLHGPGCPRAVPLTAATHTCGTANAPTVTTDPPMACRNPMCVEAFDCPGHDE